VLRSFANLSKNATSAEIQQFLNENFHHVGFELRMVSPKDWRENPKFLQKLTNPELLHFATTIHGKWRGLTRQFDLRRLCGECLASSLQLPYPFIVPGGRFREFYYWDTFWILEGLYVSEMCDTAAGMIENMFVMIEEFGFVPNGARIYYLNRSQPPLLAQMVERYAQKCLPVEKERREYFQRALPILEREYDFWSKNRSAEVKKNGRVWRINVYRAEHWIPRPESYVEDLTVASRPEFDTEMKRKMFYQNIASAAESGWDFSRRWLNSSNDLATIYTTALAPLDLNVFILGNEQSLKRMSEAIGDPDRVIKYEKMKAKRQETIDAIFKVESGGWRDFDLNSNETVQREFYISDLSPLWYIDYDMDFTRNILKQHQDIIESYAGGVPTSLTATGQQWDFPNVWAPIQYFMINLYERLSHRDSADAASYRERALGLAQRWINSTFCGFNSFGQFFEKYHGEKVGFPGGGGEYVVQEGFGWSNALTLWILDNYGDQVKVPEKCAHRLSVVTAEVPKLVDAPVPQISTTRKILLGLQVFLMFMCISL